MLHIESVFRSCVLLIAACGGAAGAPANDEHVVASGAASSTPASATPIAVTAVAASGPPLVAPTHAMSLRDARRYMVQLVNRDRATEGLPPVDLDEGPAQTAGQSHAEDMARLGFLGHWGSDGSVPEQRVTEAGGADVDFENAFCVTDEKKRELDPRATFDATDIERAESMFFHETPPNDGHRKTILGKFRKRVGIGIAMPRPLPNEIIVPCISQEFVDTYGTYEPLPRSIKAGQTLHVAGTASNDVKLGAVGIAKLDDPKALSVSELNKRRTYPQPAPSEMFWPRGYQTRLELKTNGQSFSIDVPTSAPRGLYEVSVWAQHAGEKSFGAISLRTIRVE